MDKAWAVVLTIIGIAIVFLFFPLIMDSTHDLKTDTRIDTFAAVTTGAGETAADVVLTLDLYNDAVANVLSITSSVGTDVPVAATYTAATNTLHVTGLTASESRTLTITYEYDSLTEYTGLSQFSSIVPLLVMVGIIAVLIGGMWYAVKKG